MKVKVCFNNEIHVISKVPDTLSGFVGLLKSTFQSKLPNDWALQYTDSDGDNILMNDEKDYEEFTNPDPATSTKVPKIYVISIESFRPVDEPVKVESDDIIPNKEEDDYQIIQKEEPVVTEVPKEEENPVVPEVAEVEQDVQNKWDIKEDERQVEETKEEKVVRSEVNESKVLVDLNELANMISRLIDSKLPQMVESIKNQDSSRDISLCENVVAYPGANILAEEPPKAQKAVSQVKHFGVSCSGCQMMPIVGIRYRCSVCPRFDYCERCEETCEHVHDMVKMKQRDLLDIFRPQPRPVVPEVVIPADLMEEKVEEKERKSKQEKKEEKRVRKTYYSDLKRKAKKLQKCFPKEDFDILCAYVNGAPEDMTLEELVENFKH